MTGSRKHILLVEDSPGDARLLIEALKQGSTPSDVDVVEDGDAALAYLFGQAPFEAAPRPDLVLLDLNLPGRSGLEVLKKLKGSAAYRAIPVIILSTSQHESDVLNCYENHANAYITKPVDLDRFMVVARSIDDFWMSTARLSHRRE